MPDHQLQANNTAYLAQQAFHLSLAGDIVQAQELLLRTRNELKRLSGDLAIFGREQEMDMFTEAHFATHDFAEAQAWGWLELASGVFKLAQNLPGTALMHFTRCWRIWRFWSLAGSDHTPMYEEARIERARARLWLGEAWARFMSERAQHTARAVLRAALNDLPSQYTQQLLTETIAQQRLLPPALPGSPAYQETSDKQPYICTLLPAQSTSLD